MKSMVMDFRGYKIKNLNYGEKEVSEDELSEMSKDDSGNAMSLNVRVGWAENLLDGIVELTLDIYNSNNKTSVNLTLVGDFSLAEGLTEDEVEEYLTMNGVAILFPYLRSIVSMITTLDSNDAIILPTINAAAFKD